MRLGIIARSDNTGLGNQTRELVNMLKPETRSSFQFTAENIDDSHHATYTLSHHRLWSNFTIVHII